MPPRKPTEFDTRFDRDTYPAHESRWRSHSSTPTKARKRSTQSSDASNPSLRLVGEAQQASENTRAIPAQPTPIHGATDPRWVLAVRTAEALQGDILAPDKRESLMRIGRAVGLTPFDSCLILAIIQDQARRGMINRCAPAAAQDQLAMIPLPSPRSIWSTMRDHPARIGVTLASILGIQFVLLWLWLG